MLSHPPLSSKNYQGGGDNTLFFNYPPSLRIIRVQEYMNKALITLHMKINGSDESELTCSEGLQDRRRSSGRKLSIVDAGKELIRKGSKKKRFRK